MQKHHIVYCRETRIYHVHIINFNCMNYNVNSIDTINYLLIHCQQYFSIDHRNRHNKKNKIHQFSISLFRVHSMVHQQIIIVIIISLIQLFALADLMPIFTHKMSHNKWLKVREFIVHLLMFSKTCTFLYFYILSHLTCSVFGLLLTHSKTTLENTVEIEPQPVALVFKNLS